MAKKVKEKEVEIPEGMVEIELKHKITIGTQEFHGKVIVPKDLVGTLRMLDSNANRQNIDLSKKYE